MNRPAITGIHHLKFPVSDLPVSLAWYERVLGFQVDFEFPDDDGVVRGVAGFDPVCFAIADHGRPRPGRPGSTNRECSDRRWSRRRRAGASASPIPMASNSGCTASPRTASTSPTNRATAARSTADRPPAQSSAGGPPRSSGSVANHSACGRLNAVKQ